MKRILSLAAVALISLSLIACSQTATNKAEKENGDELNQQSQSGSEQNQEELDLGYSITKEKVEDKATNTIIYYPQVSEYPGELLQDYMNQSLKRITQIYLDEETYTNVEVEYEVTYMDENILSVLFKGTGKLLGTKDINILQSINLDMTTSNEINFENFVKEDNESREEVMKILNEKIQDLGLEEVEAEGIRMYFQGENVVFYYMPLDDSAEEFIELKVHKSELEGFVNTSFGEKPAS